VHALPATPQDPGPADGSDGLGRRLNETPPTPTSERIATLEAQIVELESRLAAMAEQSTATRRRLERDLDRAIRLNRERERALAQAEATLERLRGRFVVRAGVAILRTARAPRRYARKALEGPVRLARRTARRLGLRRLLGRATGPTQDQVVARIRAALPAAPEADGRVSVIVDSRTDPPTLRACLQGLIRTDWDDLEILVAGPRADNMVRAATRGDQRSEGGRRRIRPVTGGTSADSRREALAIASGDLILLLHDDVRPVEPTWLRRMVATIREVPGGAVGARLLLPAGAGDRKAGVGGLRLAHMGLELVPIEGLPEPRAIGLGADVLDHGGPERVERGAASEACLLVDRATIDAVGLPPSALDEAEPVELCLRIGEAGGRILVDGSAVLWHRNVLAEAEAIRPLDEDDVTTLQDRWGPRLYRSVLLDRLFAGSHWTPEPLRVGITLTRDDESAGFGDWYTAHELGDAIGRLGWSVSYLEREKDRWYDGAGACDVVISLLEKFDLFQIPRHVITVAWIRNWTEEWTAKPWFDNYDLVLASSSRSKTIVEATSAKMAHVFPIATNPARFNPRPATPSLASDAVFVGSDWGVARGIAGALPELAEAGVGVAIYGRGWENQPQLASMVRGLRPYDALADIYASAAVAIDDAAISTKPYGSVNSRVFDALAAGTIVVSDNELGVRELFDADFPTWDGPETLVSTVRGLLDDPARRTELAARYRGQVLDRHTYDHRAIELRELVASWARAPKIAAHIGPQTWEMGRTWGDVPFGRDVQRNFERRGFPTSVLVHVEQGSAAALRADVGLHIFGVRAPRTIASQLNALWVISHPDRVTEALCETYDVVFMASDMLLANLSKRVEVPFVTLHQATEPTRFFPDPTGPKHQLLFVGNSRGVQRPIIEDLRDTTWDLAVYGGGWTPEMLDPKHLRGEWIPNNELRRSYSSADIVLNDHWGDMRELGIISNRVYDALACGAFVVSDWVPGIEAEFDGAVATFETREELLAVLERFLADPEARKAAAAKGRAAVLERHTFAQRVDQMLATLEPMLAERPGEVVTTAVPTPSSVPPTSALELASAAT